jgi:hypothetical protein
LLAAAITAVVMSATPMYLLWQGEGLSAGIIGIISAVVTSRCPRWLESLIGRFLNQMSQVFMPRVFECRTTS